MALLRDKLQATVVGTAFWHAQLKQRNYMSGGRYMSAHKLLHKMRCAQQELDRKQHVNYLKLTYSVGDKHSVKDPFLASPPPENLQQKTANKLKEKQNLFQQFSKMSKLENFFTYHGKTYSSPYKGMQKTPTRHVQKKVHVLAKEKRLGKSGSTVVVIGLQFNTLRFNTTQHITLQ